MPGMDCSEKVPEKVKKKKSVQAMAGTQVIGELEHRCLAWSMCDFGKRIESGLDGWSRPSYPESEELGGFGWRNKTGNKKIYSFSVNLG